MIWEYNVKFFKYFIEEKKTFFKYFGISIIVGILELFGVALTYPFINQLLTNEKLDSTSIFYACLIILAFLAKNIFMIFYNFLQADYTKTCEANIVKKFVKYFIFGDYNKISQVSLAQKNQIIGFLAPSVINNYLVRITNLIVNIFIFCLIITFLFVKFFIASCITFVCTIVLLGAMATFFKKKTTNISKQINQANENLNKTSNEAILNTKNVKILNGETYFFNKYSKSLDKFKYISKELLFYNSIPPYVTEPFIIIILLILLGIISIQNLSNATTLVASYAVIVSAVFRLAPTISRIQVNLTGIVAAFPQLKELINYYDMFELDKFNPVQEDISSFNDSIELKNVVFSYNDKPILKDLSFKINKGDFIGIAGTSGAGKTTLADIVAGLLKLNSGEIYIDGQLISSQRVPKLKIGYIPQEYNSIGASIRENVAFGSDNIDDEKVIIALKQAQLYDYVINNFEKGIYAEPFVDSVGFSQGQKQRLAIARALYLNPEILILDEATSSLDLKTENEICSVLNNLKGDKTIIAIAHRLSTIKSVDKIYFLQNSTISGIGSFEELYQCNPEFRELVLLNNTNSIH